MVWCRGGLHYAWCGVEGVQHRGGLHYAWCGVEGDCIMHGVV